jgi:hypothetical protein
MGSTSIPHGAQSDPSITDMDVQHKLQVNIEVFWKYAMFIGIGNKICWFMVMYNVIASLLEVTIA